MDRLKPIFCAWAELRPGVSRRRRHRGGRRLRGRRLIHIISQILRDVRNGPAGSSSRFAAARQVLVAKYGRDAGSEFELHVWRHLIAEDLGGGRGDWGVLSWPGIDSGSAEAAGQVVGARDCSERPAPHGLLAPVWVEEAPGETGNPNTRKAEPEAPGETKAGRAIRLARNRKGRATTRLESEKAQEWKARMNKERSAQRRSAGKRETRDEATRSENAASTSRARPSERHRGPRCAV